MLSKVLDKANDTKESYQASCVRLALKPSAAARPANFALASCGTATVPD